MATMEQFQKDFEKMRNKLLKDLKSKETMKALGEATAKDIQKRTTAGYGVKANDKGKTKLDKLSTGYKKQRKKMQLSSNTSPAKSNLHQTGKMVDSIKSETTKEGFKISATGSHNKDKAGWVSKKRPFLHMSKPEIKRAKERFEELLRDMVKKYNK